jgi:hypothetical protein
MISNGSRRSSVRRGSSTRRLLRTARIFLLRTCRRCRAAKRGIGFARRSSRRPTKDFSPGAVTARRITRQLRRHRVSRADRPRAGRRHRRRSPWHPCALPRCRSRARCRRAGSGESRRGLPSGWRGSRSSHSAYGRRPPAMHRKPGRPPPRPRTRRLRHRRRPRPWNPPRGRQQLRHRRRKPRRSRPPSPSPRRSRRRRRMGRRCRPRRSRKLRLQLPLAPCRRRRPHTPRRLRSLRRIRRRGPRSSATCRSETEIEVELHCTVACARLPREI